VYLNVHNQQSIVGLRNFTLSIHISSCQYFNNPKVALIRVCIQYILRNIMQLFVLGAEDHEIVRSCDIIKWTGCAVAMRGEIPV
jgi:hypothetical protein